MCQHDSDQAKVKTSNYGYSERGKCQVILWDEIWRCHIESALIKIRKGLPLYLLDKKDDFFLDNCFSSKIKARFQMSRLKTEFSLLRKKNMISASLNVKLISLPSLKLLIQWLNHDISKPNIIFFCRIPFILNCRRNTSPVLQLDLCKIPFHILHYAHNKHIHFKYFLMEYERIPLKTSDSPLRSSFTPFCFNLSVVKLL